MGRLSKALAEFEGTGSDCYVASLYPRRHLVFAHETNIYGLYTHAEWRDFLLWATTHYDIVQTTGLPFWPAVAECYDWLTDRLRRRHIWRETGFVHNYILREDVLPLCEYQADTKSRRIPAPERFHLRSLQVDGSHIRVDPNFVFYSSPEKGTYFKGRDVRWLPSIREPELFTYRKRQRSPGDPVRIYVGHHRTALWKGMSRIQAALRDLLADGLKIEILTPETAPEFLPDMTLFDGTTRGRKGALFGYDIPHRSMPRVLAEADIVIDQVVMGSYGNVGIEAMMSGRPVIGQKNYPELAEAPIWEAEIANLSHRIRELVEEPELWQGIGEAGRDYALRMHSPRAVARRAAHAYAEVMETAPR